MVAVKWEVLIEVADAESLPEADDLANAIEASRVTVAGKIVKAYVEAWTSQAALGQVHLGYIRAAEQAGMDHYPLTAIEVHPDLT